MPTTIPQGPARSRSTRELIAALLLAAGLVLGACSSETFIQPPDLCRCAPEELCVNEECVSVADQTILEAPDEVTGTCSEADARINELRSGGVERGDFVEVIGDPGTSLDGWVLRSFDVDGNRRQSVLMTGVIDGDGLWVGGFGGNLEAAPTVDYGATGVVGLASPAGSVQLVDCAGTLRDSVGWGDFTDSAGFAGEGDPAPTPEPDGSIARCGVDFAMIDMVDSDDNAVDFVAIAATPGEPNPACADPMP